MTQREKMINLALNEVGYKEGKNNDTKYGIWYGLNHNPWCAMFISWLAAKLGVLNKLIPKFAGCGDGWKWFKSRKLTSNIPDPGDIVFYKPTKIGATSSHVGIVVRVTSEYVYTVEGNAGYNTDGVYEMCRKRSDKSILGYAKVQYDSGKKKVKLPTLPPRTYFKKGDTGANVKLLQELLNYINNDKLVIDGIIGNKTKASVKKFQRNHGLIQDGLFGKKSLAKAKEIING